MHPLPICNTALETNRSSEQPIIGGWTFHHIVLICVGILTGLTLIVSGSLMIGHATHYSKPWEQKHIMRVLLMLPVYAVTALLISAFYRDFVYFNLISQMYEPLAVVSYLTLIVHYVAPTLEEQREWLRTKEAQPWIFPLNLLYKITGGQKGPFRTPRTALTQFNIIWFCTYQYVVVRVTCALCAVLTNAVGRYCQSSLSPYFAHLWLTIIPAISVVVAMHTLIQAHWSLRKKLHAQGIHVKLLCIKLVVFFTFWQSIIFGLAAPRAAAKVNPYIGQTDIEVVLQSLLLSIELFIFACLHIKAYSWSSYVVDPVNDRGAYYMGGVLGWKAFFDCFNLADVGRSIHRGFHWMLVERKHRNAPMQESEHSMDDSDKVVAEPKQYAAS